MNLTKLSNENFTDEVINSKTPVLVDFYADWCGPCKMIAPVVDDIATEYAEKLKVVKLDIDDAGEIAAKYSVLSIPTLILFKDGDVSKTIVGFRSKEAIIEEFGL